MELTTKNFDEEVLKSKLLVLVEFWGSWCPPCKMMDNTLNKLETEFQGKVKICKINIDRNPYPRVKYNIRGLPTFIIFKNGKEIERHVSAKSYEELRKIIKNYV